MNTLRQLLVAEGDRLGTTWDTDNNDDTLEEIMRECFEVMWTGDEDERRWRINYKIVIKIPDNGTDRFFMYSACKGTNDNSWEDAGYKFEGIDNVKEVFPREVSTTIYK